MKKVFKYNYGCKVLCQYFYFPSFKDLKGQVEKVALFLGKKITQEQLGDLTEHLKFENFSKNEAVNYEVGKEVGFMNEGGRFCRKGKWPGFMLFSSLFQLKNCVLHIC